MNEERVQEAAQEAVEAVQPEAEVQVAEAKGADEAKARPPQDVIERELRRARDEAAARRRELREKEQLLQQREAELMALKEQLALERARAELVAALGDKTAAEAALKLAKADGLIQMEGEQVRVDLEALFQRYPILRRPSAPRDRGANPPAAPQLTREAIASMSPEEYARRRKEILEALAKGLIR